MLITVKARAHYLHEQCKNRFTRIIGGFTLSNALLAHLFLVDFYLKVSCFHGTEEPDIKHAIFHFHTWIWSSDPWLAEGALSVSEATNLGITGRESTWRVLPLPISSWLSPLFFFITSSDSHTCAFFPWETAGTMPFVLLADSCFWYRHTTAFCVLEALPQPGKRPFEFRPLGQSIVLASACSEHNIPTEKVISCSDLVSAPFIKGPHGQKHNAVKGPSPPGGAWQSQQKTEDVGTGSGKAHSPKASYHHDPSPALWFCTNRNRATISSYAEACPWYIIRTVRIMDENFMHLRDWCLMKHDWACRLKLEIRCVAYK